ncbi:virion core protein, T7 gp14 family [Sphingomonas sp.]|uniref:virion core protein, T7 gp14 family n=1 Tax=Sphingomonas sp. TaxID=28214 RepID=UPI002ED9AF99
MCDPVTAAIVTTTIAVASAGAQSIAAINTAKAQTKAINEQRAAVREENRQAASAELFDQMRGARREQSRIRAAAGEAGLSLESGSVEGLLMDSAMQMELARDRTLANMESRHRANEAEASSMLSRIQQPTALGVGLNLATAAAGGWSDIQGAKIKVKNG